MKTVRSFLRVVIAEKERRERRTFGIRTIAEDSGASRSTVERLMSDTMKRVPLDDLSAICRWVPCGVEDILRLVEDVDFSDTKMET
jgi:putative transcriptional regulator